MSTVTIVEKPAAEARVYTWDFSGLLASGESISGTPTITEYESGEATSDLTIGSPTLSSPYVTALVSGGTAGKVYVLECKATATGSQALVVRGGLAVTAP